VKNKLELSEQNYRYLFENASDAMWVHDLKGNILEGNKAFAKLTGHTREELIGINILSFLISEKSRYTAREVRRRLLAGEEIEQPYEQRFIKKGGTEGVMQMASSPVVIDGEVRGFQHVARDVTEEKQLQENMKFYVQQITRAQEDERKRMSRELHDEVAPHLLLVIQHLDAIASNPRPRLPEPFKTKLEDLHTRVTGALETVRHFAQDLRPRIIDDLGLVAALEWMAENVSKDYAIDTQVKVLGQEQTLPDEVKLLLFRIAQEALNNVRRHAAASKACITLEFDEGRVVLTIRDNGKGFELPQRMGDLASIGKLGLAGMQERAQLIRGKLTIHSEMGIGTTVTVEAPI